MLAENKISEELNSYLTQGCSYFALPEFSLGIITTDCALTVFDSTKGRLETPLYKIGSLTKLITGIAILQLKEAGLVDLGARVSKYLPWFNAQHNHIFKDNITILDLLLHTSGLPRGTLFKNNPSQEEIIKSITDVYECFQPDNTSTFKYSNLGYILLGFIIEAVAKEDYHSFVKKRIFDPLQMLQSGFGIDNARNITIPHSLSYFSGQNKSPYDFMNIPLYAAPHASFDMHSNVCDFATILTCILNKGIHNGNRIFQPDTIEYLFNKSRPINQQLGSSIGLMSINAFGGTAFFQNAEHWGHSASMLIMPEKKFGLIAMANRGSAGLELWRIVQTVANYFTQNRNVKYLNYDYPNYLNVVGEYTSDCNPNIEIISKEKQLFISSNVEEQSCLVYKGRNSFIQLKGTNSKYVIRLDLAGSEVKGLYIGPYYYEKKGTNSKINYAIKYDSITGIYSNHSVGRIALFERKGKLILAYSPVKESILDQKQQNLFIQETGPFIGEPISINDQTNELKMGSIIFKKANKYTY